MNISGIGIDCVGCGNCTYVCTKNAIVMKQNRYGFVYPKIEKELCIDCGRCCSVCPQTRGVEISDDEHEAIMAVTKSRDIWRKSASGGVFGTLAHYWLNCPNSLVYGAAYIDRKVKHISISEKEDIFRIQGSKYVQSDVLGISMEIKKRIKEGKKVLFSGTPCQCSALKALLDEDERKHVCIIDLICHGVPSMKHLNKDLDGYRFKGKTVKLDFRIKQKNYFSNSAFALQIFQSTGFKFVIMSDRDPYFNLFMKGKNFRESCYQCKYANFNRVGDITIGDCDSHKQYPDFYPHTAVSTIIINSEMGSILWNQVKHLFEYRKLDMNMEAKYNHQLVQPFKKPKDYETVMEEFETLTIKALRQKYARPSNARYYISRILYWLLPDYIAYDLVMYIKRGKRGKGHEPTC